HDREQEQLDRILEVLVCDLDRGSGWWATAVVDENVDPAERLDRRVDEPRQRAGVADVAANGERAEPLRLPLECLAAAREHRDVCAFLRQRLRDSEADPGRRAADDRRPTVESEVHVRATTRV